MYRIKAGPKYEGTATSIEGAMRHFEMAHEAGFDNIQVTDGGKRVYDETLMSEIIMSRRGASTATRISIDVEEKDPVTRLSDRLRMGSGEFIKCAEGLNSPLSDLSPQYVLLFHAIELGLKAFIIKHGIDTLVLKKQYGHDLIGLYEAAKSRGMRLAVSNVDRDILWINEWHGDSASIRYEFDEQRTLPICGTLFPLAHAIFDASR
ncbi:MAG: hypothetical protein ABSG46_13635 [Candidatus Binataceae bacterium]|jgi:hypothetical protein